MPTERLKSQLESLQATLNESDSQLTVEEREALQRARLDAVEWRGADGGALFLAVAEAERYLVNRESRPGLLRLERRDE